MKTASELRNALLYEEDNDKDIKVVLTELVWDDKLRGHRKKKRYFKIDRIVPTSKTTVTIHLL